MLKKMMFAALSAAVVTPPSTGGLKAKINFTGTAENLSDWTDFFIGTPTNAPLKQPDGTLTAWRLVPVGNTIFDASPDAFTAPTIADTDFPAAVGKTEWYRGSDAGGPGLLWKFTGLDNAKTYTIKTLSYDPGAGNPTTIMWGGISQDCNPMGVAVVLTFSGLTPVSGEISGKWGGTAGNPIINALIITEN